MEIRKAINKVISKIEKCYDSYDVAIKFTHFEIIENGERFIFYARLKPGTKIESIFKYAVEVQTALGIPLFQPFKEGLKICFAVSKKFNTENRLQKMMESQAFRQSDKKLPFAVGYNIRRDMYFVDLCELHHLLVAGATGTGKSVLLTCLIFSIIAKNSVDKVNLVVFDIGADSLDMFCELPHLSCPIIKDKKTGINVMLSLAEEMERRNSLSQEELSLLPEIICIVDEFVSFITDIKDKETSKLFNSAITNLLRRGRHANIHMVLASQDSKVKSIAIDLNNIRARIAFACGTSYASVNVLGVGGAEDLPGDGTMLFKHPKVKEPIRINGAYISEEEIKRVVSGKGYRDMISTDYDFSNKFIISEMELGFSSSETPIIPDGVPDVPVSKENKELARIILWALSQDCISANKIETRFRMGKRSTIVVDNLMQLRLITEKFSKQPRLVIPKCPDDVPTDVINFLQANGVSSDDIAAAFENREVESKSDITI